MISTRETFSRVAQDASTPDTSRILNSGRGNKQLQLNIDNVIQQIDAAKLPTSVKETLLVQASNKRFEIRLFMGEVSNLNVEHLDFLRQVTGKSVQKVVVLPHK